MEQNNYKNSIYAEEDHEDSVSDYQNRIYFINQDYQFEREKFLRIWNNDFEYSEKEEGVSWSEFLTSYQEIGESVWQDKINNFIEDWEYDVTYFREKYEMINYYDAENIEIIDIDAELKWQYDYLDWDLGEIYFDGYDFIGYGYYEPTEFYIYDEWQEDYWLDLDDNNDGYIDLYEYQGFDENDDYWWIVGNGGVNGLPDPDDGYWEDGYVYVDDYYNLEDYWDINSVLIATKTYQLNYGWMEDYNWEIAMYFEEGNYELFDSFDFNINFNPETLDSYLDQEFEYNNYNYLSNYLILTGEENDVINANQMSNIISSGSGNDKISGNNGNDVIIGGLGADLINGGLGNDIFIYSQINDSINNSVDLIEDFTKGKDKIDISELEFFDIMKDDQINNHHDSQTLFYHFDQSLNQTVISDNINNFMIKLSGNISLDQGDFIFGI